MEEPEIMTLTQSKTILSLNEKIKLAISLFPHWEIEQQNNALNNRTTSDIYLPNVNERMLAEALTSSKDETLIETKAVVIKEDENENKQGSLLTQTSDKKESKDDSERHYKLNRNFSVDKGEHNIGRDTNEEKGCCCLLF